MIQRIQSLYLLAAGIAVIAMYVCGPIVNFPIGVEYELSSRFSEIQSSISDIYILKITAAVFVLAMPLIPFITIFLFRWRRLQMRFCVVEIVLLVILEALMVVQAFFMFNVVVIPLAGLLPLLGIIFSWLAYRAIRSDERLIRSIDRIR